MSELVWSRDELVRYVRSEDAEVRFWAIDRLVRHFPDDCCDAIQDFLLDDHDATPALVARHLGERGASKHHAILVRGFKLLRGVTPGHCLQALVRLGFPTADELALDALKRGDLEEAAQAIIVESFGDFRSRRGDEVVRAYMRERPELIAEPAALRGMVAVTAIDDLGGLLDQLLSAMQWKGSHRGAEVFRTVMDELKIDHAQWCFRTGPSGPIELRKTIKAVEAGYDCDILATMGESTINRIAQRFRVGNVSEMIRAISEWTVPATREMKVEPGSELPRRIEAVVSGLAEPARLERIERLGAQFQEWVLGFQLSAAFTVARFTNRTWTLKQATGRLEPLLELAQEETAFHLSELPHAILEACGSERILLDRAQDWCLRMLEAQGPFFPKVVALETLGELQAVHFIPEIMAYLSEENSYIYGAAERALAKTGEAIVPAAVARIESQQLDPDAAHSLLVLLCDLGTAAAFRTVLDHLDFFMDTVGPGNAAEWVSLFGAEELISPLRDWLEHDRAMVGQALLLIAAIHNVRLPEEEEIVQAIEDERARQAAEAGMPELDDTDEGDYVM